MFCPKCGQQIPDNSSFCSKCGVSIGASQPPSAPAPTPILVQQVSVAGQRTSGMAVTALVLGIVGFFLNFLSILAIIFGAIGMNQTGKDPTLKGRGMAVTGLVLGIIVLALWIVVIIWVGSAFWWVANSASSYNYGW